MITHGEQTASDVITESLTRTWIDRPAVERRAELAAPLQRAAERDRPLPDHVVRQLLERAHEIERAQRRAHWDVDQARRDLDNVNHRRARLRSTIDDYEKRIADSRQVLAEHDRPLHRRRHRHEIESAQAQLRWMPDALEKARAELTDVTAAERQAVPRLLEASARVAVAREVGGEHAAIAVRLASDRRARARDAVDDPAIIERLGQRPPLATAAEPWDEAAGRVAQHRAAFGEGVAAHPRFTLDDTARSESERAAVASIATLDHALGRSRGVDRSLGLSL